MNRDFAYKSEPFPHLVFDWSDMDYWWESLRSEFPPPGSHRWSSFNNEQEVKHGCEAISGPFSKALYGHLSDPRFVELVKSSLRIDGEVTASLEGGGYHWLPVGGKLGVHVDFNQSSNGLYRRANCLVYLNPGWGDDDGGELVLRGGAEVSYSPEQGRCVVFPTGQNTWHGNPNPCRRDRYSFAVYYFSTEPPADHPGHAHTTVFR